LECPDKFEAGVVAGVVAEAEAWLIPVLELGSDEGLETV
jgi:hypothetical protein